MITRFLFLGFLLCPLLNAQTSTDNARLKAALEKFPTADADKDGVLTMAEAKAFKDKQKGATEKDPAEKGQAEKGKKGAAPAPEGGEKHVFWGVFGTQGLPRECQESQKAFQDALREPSKTIPS